MSFRAAKTARNPSARTIFSSHMRRGSLALFGARDDTIIRSVHSTGYDTGGGRAPCHSEPRRRRGILRKNDLSSHMRRGSLALFGARDDPIIRTVYRRTPAGQTE